MEFALESETPCSESSFSAKAASPNTFLAPVWQSSKLPRTAPHVDVRSALRGHLAVLDVAHPAVGIHDRDGDMGRVAEAFEGGLPVSPDVATRIRKSWSSLPCSRSWAADALKKRGRHCSAISL